MSGCLNEAAAYVCQCEFDGLPADVLIRSKEVIADSLAVIAAGAQEEEVKTLTERILVSDTPRVAMVIGAGLRTEPLKAGLINGTAGTFLELEEGNKFAQGHPGIHVLPALLAVAEERKRSGKDLLTAFVLGYEIGARIGIACEIRMSMHPHGTWGTVGAAVAVGKLMGYNEQAMKELINVSSSLTLATSRRTMLEGGTVRNVYAGVSGYMGILAYHLVESGFTGERDGLKTVFGSVVSETFVPEEMTKDLGQRFEIARNYFKRHACIRANHATLDALSAIIAQIPGGHIRPEDVDQVEVMTYSTAAQFFDQNPLNSFAAKFSIPFAVATFIVHGHAGVSSFTSQAVNNLVIRALAQKVIVVENSNFTAMMPDRRPARVRLTLSDGKALEAETFTNKGDAEDPYNPVELKEKYFELVEPIWGHELAGNIYTDVMALEELKNINQLTEKMSKKG